MNFSQNFHKKNFFPHNSGLLAKANNCYILDRNDGRILACSSKDSKKINLRNIVLQLIFFRRISTQLCCGKLEALIYLFIYYYCYISNISPLLQIIGQKIPFQSLMNDRNILEFFFSIKVLSFNALHRCSNDKNEENDENISCR